MRKICNIKTDTSRGRAYYNSIFRLSVFASHPVWRPRAPCSGLLLWCDDVLITHTNKRDYTQFHRRPSGCRSSHPRRDHLSLMWDLQPRVINTGGAEEANERKPGYELKNTPWSQSGGSTSEQRDDCRNNMPAHTVVAVWKSDGVSDFNSNSYFFICSPFFLLSPLSQSARETKAASHVLQTVWSFKELRNALMKDGWNKSHFQVQSVTLAGVIPTALT